MYKSGIYKLNTRISSINYNNSAKSTGNGNPDENISQQEIIHPGFFEYWGGLGYFDNIRMFLPKKFYLLFEIARLISSPKKKSDADNAIEELLKKETAQDYDREKSIQVNRMEKRVPLGDKMDIQYYKTIYDLKKAIPRELAWDKQVFNIKLFTRTLLVQRHFEAQGDRFKPISQVKDETGRLKSGFEQKFYLLLDRSRSMENRMRSFYSKSIVVEFLRRKLDTNAKLYYRAFDSKPGSLMKIENKEDFSALIEKVILTTTGGASTNMQAAVFQAIKDMSFEKDMAEAEILVVTDGLVHDLDKIKMKENLKDIKLNFLKIGRDLAEPDGYEIKRVLSEAGHDFDPFSLSIKDIKKKLQTDEEINTMSVTEQRLFRFMIECSEKIVKDLKEISHKYIEIDDIKLNDVAEIKKEVIESIEKTIEQLLNTDLSDKTIQELAVIYKKAYFLSQYLQFLMESGKEKGNMMLKEAVKDLESMKEKLLGNPILLNMVSGTGGFEDDKKAIKAAKKEARKKLKEMNMQSKALSKDDIKNAELIFSMSGVGGGSGGGSDIFRILFIKLWEMIKSVITRIKK